MAPPRTGGLILSRLHFWGADQYDVWGAAVNTAARLEQTGERGRIQVSEEFAERIPGFPLEERGTVELKGIGSKRTFWLLPQGR